MSYRLLTSEEISLLLSQGCSAVNWSDISVKEGFSAKNLRNTRFEGRIKLGILTGIIDGADGSFKDCGIYNSNIRNCEISDNVYISEVKNLTNYFIADNVTIENAGSVVMTGESTFGNGTEIDVLNEGGGRGLPIFDILSSQVAYLTVLYRHDKEFTGKILGMISNYTMSKRSTRGRIETGCRIRDSMIIRNVYIGSYTVISGACLT